MSDEPKPDDAPPAPPAPEPDEPEEGQGDPRWR